MMSRKQNPAEGGGGAAHVPEDTLSVDGRKVSMQLFEYEYMRFKRNIESYYGTRIESYPQQMAVRTQVMESLITQELLLAEARRRGIGADSAEVNKLINQEMSFVLGGEKEEAGFKGYLAKKDREKQFRESLTQIGMSYDAFKKAVQRDATRTKVIDVIAADKKKEEQKKALARALEVVKKLQTKEPFENVVREFSEDEATKNNGGNLGGWLRRGVVSKQVEDAAFKLQPGQFTEAPVLADDGYHIIQLLAKREAAGPEFEAAKQDIIKKIRESKGDETLKVSDAQIKKEYEMFAARQVLIRIKTKDQIASEWIKKERESGKHKIVEINPEMRAYRYLYKPMFEPGAKTPNPDEAIRLYERAAASDPRNPYPHYELANIYKMKSSGNIKEKTENNPYTAAKEAAAGTAKGNKKETQWMKEALRELKQAKETAVANNNYDPMIFIAYADTAKSLGLSKIAIGGYADAVDTSAAGNRQFLEQIKKGLTGYKAKKAKNALKDVNGLLAELDAIDKENAEKAAAAQKAAEPEAGGETPAGGAQPVANPQQGGAAETQPAQQPAGKPTSAAPGKVIKTGSFVVKKGAQPAAKPAAPAAPASKPAAKPAAQPVAPAAKPVAQPATPAPAEVPPAPAQPTAPEQPK
jgi:foldase protein PrsA